MVEQFNRQADRVEKQADAVQRQPLVNLADKDIAKSSAFKPEAARADELHPTGFDFKQDVQNVAGSLGNNGDAFDLSDNLKKTAADAGKKFDPGFVDQLKGELKNDGMGDLSVKQVSPKVLQFNQDGSNIGLKADVNGRLAATNGAGSEIDKNPQDVLDEWKHVRAGKTLTGD